MATFTEILAAVDASSQNTYAPTFSASASVGDLVVVQLGTNNTTAIPASLSDSAGNSYTLIQQPQDGSHRSAMYYCVLTNAITGGTTTLTATQAAATRKTLKATRVSGITTVSLDKSQVHSLQGSTTAPDTGTTAATTQAVEVAFAQFLYAGAPSFTPPAGWTQTATTQQTTSDSAASISSCYKLLAATGTQSATATLGAAQVAGGAIATFKYTDVVPSAFIPTILAFG